MEEHPLLREMATWPGRGPIQLAFESLGFTLHKAWQDRITLACGEQAHLVNRYWDEVALETMQSLGQGNPNLRKFTIEPKYRSAFLDNLFASRDFFDPAFPGAPLVRCLFDHSKKMWLDGDFRAKEVAFFSSLRRAEVERLGITAPAWSKKQDAIPFVEEFSIPLGFRRHCNRWRKIVNGRLVFEVGLELTGNRFRIKPRLIFRIFCSDDPSYAFDMLGDAVLDRLVPGVARYFPGTSVSEYILGVKAHVELFNLIASSFEGKLG